MKTDIVVAIHQPNFLPWLGYFDKILSCDAFVFLDDVQVVKTGSSWFNRVMFPNQQAQEGMWVTVPFHRQSGEQTINKVETVNFNEWKKKFFRTLENYYAHCDSRNEVLQFLHDNMDINEPNLCELNIKMIHKLCKAMNLCLPTNHFQRSSEMKISSSGTQRLVDITKKSGGSIYLCGGGSADYFEEKLFSDAGLKVIFQKFKFRQYEQVRSSKFIPGLSVIDLIMNVGFLQAGKFLSEKHVVDVSGNGQ